MKETVFKVGDKVYCVLYGWGKVTGISSEISFPITVEFNGEGDEERYYSRDGKYNFNSSPTLSFTEYTLNGFSQERPIELPEVGEEIMVSVDGRFWVLGKFSTFFPQMEYPVVVTFPGDDEEEDYKYFKRLR
jgi:hypothetical protein